MSLPLRFCVVFVVLHLRVKLLLINSRPWLNDAIIVHPYTRNGNKENSLAIIYCLVKAINYIFNWPCPFILWHTQNFSYYRSEFMPKLLIHYIFQRLVLA